jgi:hypothetical protein
VYGACPLAVSPRLGRRMVAPIAPQEVN